MSNHQYITVKKTVGYFYVEGTYNQNFISFLKTLPRADRSYEPDAKRWKVEIDHLSKVIDQARATFEIVYYGEGGDYDEVTMGGQAYVQGKLFEEEPKHEL